MKPRLWNITAVKEKLGFYMLYTTYTGPVSYKDQYL